MTNVASPRLHMDTELCRLLKQYVKDFRPGDWAERHGGRSHGVKSNLKKGKPRLF